jgi:multidrug efflux system membrane fusion protein
MARPQAEAIDCRIAGERQSLPSRRTLERVLASPRRSLRRSRWTLAAAVIVFALCGAFGWRYFYGAGAGGRDKPSSAQAPAPIPVTVAQAKTADFPVYLNGLGSVQPYQTVLIRSRIDGAIVKIAFKQGQMVKQGDVLAQVDPRPYQAALDQAQAKKTQDEASLKDAQLNLQRYTELAKKDSVSLQQLDTQQATVDQLTAQIKGDQAIIDNAQTQFDYTTIRSPITGKTGFRQVDAGNIVHAVDTTGIVTIVQLQPISVVFTAPEEDVPQINKALAAGVTPVTALSSDGLRTLSQGHLSVVNAAIDPASGSIGMKATFENADGALWPGLSVSTRLLVDTLKQVTVVPDGAVERGPSGLYAFVVGADNRVATRAITVGEEGDGQSVVPTGLTAGETVVTAGQYRLVQGSLIEPNAASSATPSASAAPSAPVKAP